MEQARQQQRIPLEPRHGMRRSLRPTRYSPQRRTWLRLRCPILVPTLQWSHLPRPSPTSPVILSTTQTTVVLLQTPTHGARQPTCKHAYLSNCSTGRTGTTSGSTRNAHDATYGLNNNLTIIDKHTRPSTSPTELHGPNINSNSVTYNH